MKLQVLIIEDESIVGIHIKKTIVSMGHKVLFVAKNGADALKIAEHHRVDLVISDINIQGDIDGIECSTILQKKYNLPVIFLTAYRDINTLTKASQVDFVGYLVKPFREDELETMVNLAILKYGVSPQVIGYKICKDYNYCYKTEQLSFQNSIIPLTKKERINFYAHF